MLSKKIILDDQARFHVRPAAHIVETAKRFQSLICISTDDYVADCKNALSLMRLGTPSSKEIEIVTDGVDEIDAMSEIEYTIIKMYWR